MMLEKRTPQDCRNLLARGSDDAADFRPEIGRDGFDRDHDKRGPKLLIGKV
jgi:hypothetical protein